MAPRLLLSALRYAALGWPVLPLRPAAKEPHGALAPHGLHDATADRERLAHWWRRAPEANVGIATGRASGLLVVDVDGPAGVASWRGLVAVHGWPRTLVQRTGSGGYQVFFRRPDRDIVPNRTKALPGIDVRGDGGYVVAPPSVHPCGERYRWFRHEPPAPCPAWLVEALYAARRATGPPRPARTAPRPAGASGARLEALCRTVAVAPDGRRNHTLNWAVWRAREEIESGALAADAVADALAEAGRACGLCEREIAATIRSGLRSRTGG